MLIPYVLFAKRPGAFNDELEYIYVGLILCFALYFLMIKLLKKKAGRMGNNY